VNPHPTSTRATQPLTASAALRPASRADDRGPVGRARAGLFARLGAGACAGFFVLALVGCATSPINQSQDLWSEGHFEEAVTLLKVASDKNPDDRRLLAAYHRRRDLALSQLTIAADSAVSVHHLDEAQDLYQRALRLDPNWERAKDGLDRLMLVRRLDSYLVDATKWADEGRIAAAEGRLRQILAADPGNHAAKHLLQQLRERQQESAETSTTLKSALARRVSIEFRETPLRSVFEVLSRYAGLNFVFDHDVKTDAKIAIFIKDNAVEDVLRVILNTNALDRKVLNDNTLLIYPNTAAKVKEYQDLVVRTFYLVNAEAKQVESMLKTMAHVKDIFIDEKLNMVVIRDTPDAVRLAERMVESIDISEAEVMLELEVVELSRTRAQNLGIQLPSSLTRQSSAPLNLGATAATGAGTTTAGGTGGVIAPGLSGALITTFANPLLVANLFMQDTDTNLLANPRIRVKSREKAKVLIGEKLPVFTSTAVQNAGVASSVQYIDVGLKLEVEPQVYLDDEVGIKVNLEVNSNLGTVSSGGTGSLATTAYIVGTRTATTNLRLHDGETQVLAGLINDNESDSWNKVPGLSDLPGIGRLFSNDNSTHEKTEIVLLVTPRIVRNLATPDTDRLLVPAGTESSVGARPLSIGATAPRSLSVRGTDTGTRPSTVNAPAADAPPPDGPSAPPAAAEPALPPAAAPAAATPPAAATAAPQPVPVLSETVSKPLAPVAPSVPLNGTPGSAPAN
jgi:general secretion pathway protein D